MSEKQEIVINTAITKDELRLLVDKYVSDGMSYTESIIEICEQRQVEPEDIAKIIKGSLKLKLEAEAMDRNIIKRTTSSLY